MRDSSPSEPINGKDSDKAAISGHTHYPEHPGYQKKVRTGLSDCKGAHDRPLFTDQAEFSAC